MKGYGNASTFASIRRLSDYWRPYRFWVWAKLLSTILMAINDIFLVYIINVLINASVSGDTDRLMEAIYMMIVMVVVGVLVNSVGVYSSGKYSACAVRDLKASMSDRIGKLPVSYIERRHSGDFSSRLTNDTGAIESFLNHEFTAIVFHAIRTTVCLGLMFYLNWQLALFCVGMIALMIAVTEAISRPLKRYSSDIQQGMARFNTVIQDTIGGIHMIKAYNLVQVLYRNCQALMNHILRQLLRIERRVAAMGGVRVFVQTVPFVVFFLFGGFLVLRDMLTIGALLAFAQLINYLTSGLAELPNLFTQYKRTAGVVDHLFEMMDQKTERTDGVDHGLKTSVPALEFNHVSFSYDGKSKVLEELSFTLPQGKTIALVGTSGSGKSTIFKLITGFYEHDEGTIQLFDEPLGSWNLAAARSKLSLVSQDTFLFPGSILDNLTCARDDVRMEDVERAASMANIDGWIRTLPEGYQTIVGERGAKLSGGQRQRVAIARAILKDAPILLLDEATSALDSESEQLVQEAISRMMENRSVLVVAHRLSTIVDADQILVLDQGRIVESGTHHQLLSQSGVYHRLYNEQLSKQKQPYTETGSMQEGLMG